MENYYKLYTDGSYFQLEDIAGFGGYILDPTGKTVLEFSDIIKDPNCFNHHESTGLKRGLELAIEKGIKNIECYTDDQVLAKIFSIENKKDQAAYLKNTILKDIVKLIDNFDSMTCTYIPRRKNKRADILSRKKIKELKELLPENHIKRYFSSDKIDYANKYKNKEMFIVENKTFTDYIVVDCRETIDEINVYYAKKNLEEKTITSELISSKFSSNKTTPEILETLNDSLEKYTHLGKCVIKFFGGHGTIIEKMVKGEDPLTHSILKEFERFEAILGNYDRVIYHTDETVLKEALKLGYPKNEKSIYFKAIKELGDINYYFGKTPEIESLIPIKGEKKNDIAEIQKIYFNEFLKLHIKEAQKENPMLSSKEKKDLVMTTILKVKEDLVEKGVKLRM